MFEWVVVRIGEGMHGCYRRKTNGVLFHMENE